MIEVGYQLGWMLRRMTGSKTGAIKVKRYGPKPFATKGTVYVSVTWIKRTYPVEYATAVLSGSMVEISQTEAMKQWIR
jgi:hypothetical protein